MSFDQGQVLFDLIIHSALVQGKPAVFIRIWFNKEIVSIQDLLDDTGCIMSYFIFKYKYSRQSIFFQYYQGYKCYIRIFIDQGKNQKQMIQLGNSLSLQIRSPSS